MMELGLHPRVAGMRYLRFDPARVIRPGYRCWFPNDNRSRLTPSGA